MIPTASDHSETRPSTLAHRLRLGFRVATAALRLVGATRLGLSGLTVVLVVSLLALSCSANRMYRPISIVEYPDYTLAFIEFDDQGELWAPVQLERALAHLERFNTAEAGVALAIFAHGWNSDASSRQEKDPESILYRYKAMLARLAEGIEEELPDLDLPIMGVYLSWRGRVSSVPLLRQASFYNRRGAAERIAGASATEAIYRILTTLRQNPASRSVLVGHSFGSIILERALAQAAVSALLAAPSQELIFPADLVVLLNPAGSANQTKQLVDILARNRLKTYRFDDAGNRFERPLLVSFTSEADTATRHFFPAGMRVKAMSKKFRDYGQEYCGPISSQRRLYTQTAGNVPELHSHVVDVGPKRGRFDGEPLEDRLIPEFLNYEERYDPLTQQIAFSFDGEEHRFTVRQKPRALNDTPYWIMQVPRELIPNHSDVLTEDSFRLIEAVLTLSATYDANVTTIVEREDGVRPVAITPLPDGTALFLDRSRGVYAVRRDSPRPIFVSCLSEAVDPSDMIGFHLAGHLAYAVLMAQQGSGADRRCSTELHGFEIADGEYRQLVRRRFVGSDCYSAAAVDLTEQRVLLSLDTPDGPQLRAADLAEETLRPRELLQLQGRQAPTFLLFQATSRRLFAALRESGELWATHLDAANPSPRLIVADLGWPTVLAYSQIDRRLYVTDAKQGALWALDCAELCQDPTVFLQSQTLRNPTTLAVALDGTLWLGDLEGQTLTAIARDGTIETTIRYISGIP